MATNSHNYQPIENDDQQQGDPSPNTAATTSNNISIAPSQRDGVFSNLTAKQTSADNNNNNEDQTLLESSSRNPSTTITIPGALNPPAYDAAVQDAVPPYTEATIFLDNASMDVINGMPLGSWLTFCLSALVSCAFEFVGFVLSFLISSDQAGKLGSFCGLGFTLILFGIKKVNPEDPLAVDPMVKKMMIIVGFLIIFRSFYLFVKFKKIVRNAMNPQSPTSRLEQGSTTVTL